MDALLARSSECEEADFGDAASAAMPNARVTDSEAIAPISPATISTLHEFPYGSDTLIAMEYLALSDNATEPAVSARTARKSANNHQPVPSAPLSESPVPADEPVYRRKHEAMITPTDSIGQFRPYLELLDYVIQLNLEQRSLEERAPRASYEAAERAADRVRDALTALIDAWTNQNIATSALPVSAVTESLQEVIAAR
jgi:hypothetical protein